MSEQVLQYARASRFSAVGTSSTLELVTAGGTQQHDAPFFFDGFVDHADAVAAALLIVGRVARTRFYVPPTMIAAALRAADPVVTSTPDGIRFESFSPCAGVYARLDLDVASVDASVVASGVTNVDFNPEMRALLASVVSGEPMRLTVGTGDVTIATLDSTVTEKKVPLPERWLRSFAEAQVVSRSCASALSLNSAEARRFVAGLPRSTATKSVMWVTAAGRGVRLASSPGATSVGLAGAERLRVIEPILRFATGVRVYAPDAVTAAASFWQADLPMGRLVVGFSPEKSRGFSGEGQLLDDLVASTDDDDVDAVLAHLSFESRLDPGELASSLGLSAQRVATALARLASQGHLGFDLHSKSYFYRPLPYESGLLEQLHPRIAGARALLESGSVDWGEDATATVTSKGIAYRVRLSTPQRPTETCTCAWYGKYRGDRGACKHVLAAKLARADAE